MRSELALLKFGNHSTGGTLQPLANSVVTF